MKRWLTTWGLLLSTLLLSTLPPAASTLRGEDWPQWRGAHRDGVWRETGVVESFPAGGPRIVWRTPVGPGYSGPTVAGGRVFVSDRVNQPQQERVRCFDARTGKPLWEDQYDAVYRISYRAGPRACVTVADEVCYSLGAVGHLRCLRVEDGELLWARDLDADYRITESKRMPIWGLASAPLVYQDLLILQAAGADGACFLGLDRKTGAERWRALDDRASYSAPILIRQGEQDVAVVWTGDRVAGLDPATGKSLWDIPFPSLKMPIGIATPVFDGKRLFITSFYDGALMLELNPDKPAARELWRRRGDSELKTDALHSIISTPLLQNGYIYGVDSYGELRCLDANSGDRVWEDLTATPKARWSNIHFVPNGERTWMFNERGELLIGKLSPQGFEEIDRAKVIEPTRDQLPQRGGVCWAHPAFANRRMYIRNDESLICVELDAQAAPQP